MELAHDDPFRPVNDKCAISGHQGNLPKIYLLFLHGLDVSRFRFLVDIPDHKPQGHLDRSPKGHPLQQTLIYIVLRLSQSVTHKLQGCRFVKIPYGKDALENRLKADILPSIGIHVCLQELVVRLELDID